MSHYNTDELEAPAWISKAFLQNVLRLDEKNDALEVVNVVMSPATLKGDHFASCMFRAKVEYRKESQSDSYFRSLIIKTMPELDTVKGEMLSNSSVFETEISMYTEALPKIEKILLEHGDNTRFGPTVVYHSLSPHKVIIFEDLCELGYDTIRERYMSMEELKSVLLKIAKLHAVSYSMGKSAKSEQVTKYTQGLFSDPKCFEVELFNGGIKRFIKLLESNDELRVYLPQFLEAEEEVQQGCLNLYNAYKNGDTEDIFVLNHGDFHSRNLMFKYNAENEYEDVKMVDFQLSTFAPSIVDLTYAVFMMFDLKTRREKQDELMCFYFENFIDSLKMIGFQGKLPTYAQFQMSKLKYRAFCKFLLVTFLPLILMLTDKKMDDLKDIDFSDVVFTEDTMMAGYFYPGFIEEMKIYLPILLKNGYLD